MKKTIAAWVCATVVLLFASVSLDASATVTYHWFPAKGSHGLPNVPSGQIEVTDAGWNTGGVNYQFDYDGAGGPADPSSPLVEIGFAGGLYPGTQVGDYPWFVHANLSFGNLMTGSLSVRNIESTFSMRTLVGGSLWTITGFSSDDPQWNCGETCSGATGYWALDRSMLPVPEPDPFVAFGSLAFGLLGADAARRWRRARHRELPVALA